jgi:DNA-binding transcriptional regulator/RsmH inhibitor MraZ
VFVGTFEHSLDDKGRVVLPSAFRSHLAERGFV